MEFVKYREIGAQETERLKEIDPSHFIKNLWREIDGKQQLVEINKQIDGWPAPFQQYYNKYKITINEDGRAFGAFNNEGKLVGYATINHDFFGKNHKYLLLDCLFVSGEYQNLGIGKKLFNLCASKAKEWGADKIYICAISSESAIAFYRKLGCLEAKEVNEELYASDPTDMQLECELDRINRSEAL